MINTSSATTYAYVMQSTKLPQHTIAALEKIHRNFFWGDSERKRTLHTVAWDRVYKPKELGGLAIPNLTHLNMAYMVKLG